MDMLRFRKMSWWHTTISDHELIRIANWSTEVTAEEMREMLARGCRGAHESVMRSYQILGKVKRLLEMGTPVAVVLELIALMESDDCQPYEAKNAQR